MLLQMVKLFVRAFFVYFLKTRMPPAGRGFRSVPMATEGKRRAGMEKRVLIVTTTHEFLLKFEGENVGLLQRMGYTVHYATNMEEPRYVSQGEQLRQMGVVTHHIAIARSPFRLRDNYKALIQLLELIRRYRFQVIHCHTPVGGLLGRLAGRLGRDSRPFVIYTAHGFHFYKGAPLWNRLVYHGAEKLLARWTDALLVINEEDYRAARHFHLRRGGALYKIPGAGLDRERFHPVSEEERKQGRAELGMDEGVFFLLSVGELNENKNHGVVLDALARLREEGESLSDFRYGICGDGFLRRRLEERIRELKLEKVVTLYGYCDHVPRILGCADAAVFPSRREGLGMAGLEALAMGVPLIAADNRGTREYMEQGENGFLCRYDDPEGFARAIRQARRMSARQRTAMRARCIDSVRPFDRAYTTAMMERIYAVAADGRGWHTHEQTGKSQRHYGRI